jgi:hypothetical protein
VAVGRAGGARAPAARHVARGTTPGATGSHQGSALSDRTLRSSGRRSLTNTSISSTAHRRQRHSPASTETGSTNKRFVSSDPVSMPGTHRLQGGVKLVDEPCQFKISVRRPVFINEIDRTATGSGRIRVDLFLRLASRPVDFWPPPQNLWVERSLRLAVLGSSEQESFRFGPRQPSFGDDARSLCLQVQRVIRPPWNFGFTCHRAGLSSSAADTQTAKWSLALIRVWRARRFLFCSSLQLMVALNTSPVLGSTARFATTALPFGAPAQYTVKKRNCEVCGSL